jgi:hypothetical protein
MASDELPSTRIWFVKGSAEDKFQLIRLLYG